MSRVKLGPGFTLVPVAAGGGHLTDIHTGDALVVSADDMALLEQAAVRGLDLDQPGARPLFERFSPFLSESEDGEGFYELELDDAPSIAPVTSAEAPRPSPSKPASLGPLIAEELRRTEPLSALIDEELVGDVTVPTVPTIEAPPNDLFSAPVTDTPGEPLPAEDLFSPESSAMVAAQSAALFSEPVPDPQAPSMESAALFSEPVAAPHAQDPFAQPVGVVEAQPEPWSIEPAPQAFVPAEAKDLAKKIAAAQAPAEPLAPRAIPSFEALASGPDDDEPMAEIEALPDDEEPITSAMPLAPAPSEDVLSMVGQPVVERTPSWTAESPAPGQSMTLEQALDLPTQPGTGFDVTMRMVAAVPPPAAEPSQSQADHLRQVLDSTGFTPQVPTEVVSNPGAPSLPAQPAAARGRALTFALIGVAVLVVGVVATLALRPADQVEPPPERPVAVVDAGTPNPIAVTPPPAREPEDAGAPTLAVAVVDAGAPVAVKPDQPDQPDPEITEAPTTPWVEAAVQARGRVRMTQVLAPADGAVTWSVAEQQRVKTKQKVGTVTRANGTEAPLISDNVGLLFIKQNGDVKKGSVLADVIYFEAWGKTVVQAKPTSAWKCQVASASKGRTTSCKISIVTPKPGGSAQIMVAIEPLWFDDAEDAVIRVAP